MRNVLKWAGIGLLVLLVVLGGLWSLSRWMVPTREQKQALAVLAQKDVPEGRNAFPAIWLLPYDVPEEQFEAITVEDAERFRWLPVPDPTNQDFASTQSVAEERFGRIVGKDSDSKRCSLREPGCLAKVRADPVGYAQWRQANAVLFERAQAISQYDYYRYPFPMRMDLPMPGFQYFTVLPTVRAIDFAEGKRDQAIDGVCRDLGMWRKLSKGADSLIASMIAAAGIRGSSRLLAEMLQELPANFTLPKSCQAAAVAPAVDELSLCNAMRGEASYAKSIAEVIETTGKPMGNRLANVFSPLLFDSEGMEAMMAPTYAWACSQEAIRQVADDQPLEMPLPSNGLARFECFGNFAGCVLGGIATPAFDDYLRRGQDSGAQLRLLDTLLWLRENADDKRPLAERLASLPEAIKSPTRNVEVADDGKALAIRMFYKGHGERFLLPLPAYLQDIPVTN